MTEQTLSQKIQQRLTEKKAEADRKKRLADEEEFKKEVIRGKRIQVIERVLTEAGVVSTTDLDASPPIFRFSIEGIKFMLRPSSEVASTLQLFLDDNACSPNLPHLVTFARAPEDFELEAGAETLLPIGDMMPFQKDALELFLIEKVSQMLLGREG